MDTLKRIIACAFEVQRTLGNGFTKSIYENAFSLELADKGFSHVRNTAQAIHYKSKTVGNLTAGFIVENTYLIEIQNKKEINELQIKSFKRKLSNFQLKTGLLINFEEKNVTFKRVVI